MDEQSGQANDAERHDDFEAALAELDPEYEGEDYYRIIAPEEIKKIVARLRAARWPTGCYSREDCLAFARWIRDECEVCDGGSTLLSNDEIETMWDDAERNKDNE